MLLGADNSVALQQGTVESVVVLRLIDDDKWPWKQGRLSAVTGCLTWQGNFNFEGSVDKLSTRDIEIYKGLQALAANGSRALCCAMSQTCLRR